MQCTWVVEQVLPPGLQHRRHADRGAKMLGIGGDRLHRLGRRPEQDVVNRRLVLQGNRSDRRRHREHHMEIRDRQQLGLAIGEPLARASPWHFGQCRLRQEL
jgi:hypothetical protein